VDPGGFEEPADGSEKSRWDAAIARLAFATDRIRDATLPKHDLRVPRVTGDRLDNAPGEVVADVLALKPRARRPITPPSI
jgi:hypothetical protein